MPNFKTFNKTKLELYIKIKVEELNALWNTRMIETDTAVRDYQTDLYNEMVDQLNCARTYFTTVS
jgi:3-dehydroquinate dehydratase